MLSGEWAVELLLGEEDSAIRRNAFRITLGHEMTHLKYNWKCKKRPKADKKFSHWVEEVHADFGAAEIAGQCSRESLISSCEYKLRKQKGSNNKYKNELGSSHPSWNQRMDYAKRYDFDDKLIRQIAKDVGCKNQRLIKKSCEFFGTIHLN